MLQVVYFFAKCFHLVLASRPPIVRVVVVLVAGGMLTVAAVPACPVPVPSLPAPAPAACVVAVAGTACTASAAVAAVVVAVLSVLYFSIVTVTSFTLQPLGFRRAGVTPAVAAVGELPARAF